MRYSFKVDDDRPDILDSDVRPIVSYIESSLGKGLELREVHYMPLYSCMFG